MQINLKELAAGGETIRLTDSIELSSEIRRHIDQDALSFGPIDVDLSAHFTAGVAELSGKLRLQIVQGCSRCLKPVQQTLTIPFREFFTQLPEAVREDENEMFHLVEAEKVDLQPYLEENVVIALPYAPLCEVDCKGICPTCGVNRNEEECNCKTDTIDPRLAGLADFFK